MAEQSVTVIGPECFASADGSVICWRGENYVRQSEIAQVELVDLAEIGRQLAEMATEHSNGRFRAEVVDGSLVWHFTPSGPVQHGTVDQLIRDTEEGPA
jgi:hypothetical protein